MAYCDRFTRSRPYKNSDNGHVEQKNWTRVRHLLGYDRLDDPELVAAINTLYPDCWEPLHYYFLPSAKLDRKTRDGAQVKRRHDKPRTPCDRLLSSEEGTVANNQKLRALKASLNPFEPYRQLETGLGAFLHQALHSSRPTDSFHCAPDTGTTAPIPES